MVGSTLVSAGCVTDLNVGKLGPDALPPGVLDGGLVGPDGGLAEPTDAAVTAAPPLNLDVLFVIDNSGSMGEKQELLTESFPRYLDELDKLPGGRPNLHLGVVSTNMGVGLNVITACLGGGDNGRLQNLPRGACDVPTDPWINDVSSADGRQINYPAGATLAETFACIARLGTTGCALEQPLEAMRAALDGRNPENLGFFRPDAFLAVVIVTDEDDCSAADLAMFEPGQTALSDPLGPLSSFRCTEFGIICDGDPIARAPATYQECESRPDSYLRHPFEYADFLDATKASPYSVFVGVIAGTPSPVKVGIAEDGKPELLPSCASDAGTATPAVRLRNFVDELPGRGTFISICRDNLGEAITFLGAETRRAILLSPENPPGAIKEATSGCACVVDDRTQARWTGLIVVVLALWPRRRRQITLARGATGSSLLRMASDK